jgi:hypothetical protein
VPTAAAKKYAIEAGVKGAKSWNFGAFLSSAEDKVFKAPAGWELTGKGREHVAVSRDNLDEGLASIKMRRDHAASGSCCS